ncbi:MAG TPA: hypothetical protein VNN10_14895 [Dehalococcoidia bacterium]|nr:hypothetical protein [Dehalococcoidia bacterium]
MTRPSDIKDPGYREAMEAADRAIDQGDYAGAVRACAEAYVRLVAQRPDILKPDRQVRPSLWPQLGVRLEVEPGAEARLVWERERFTMSEAATFLEFVMDQVVRAERTPAPQP